VGMGVKKALKIIQERIECHDDDSENVNYYWLKKIIQSIDEEKQIHPSSAEYLTKQVYEINKKITELDSKLGGAKKKMMDKLEERLKKLEGLYVGTQMEHT
jgi:hypothetical protein